MSIIADNFLTTTRLKWFCYLTYFKAAPNTESGKAPPGVLKSTVSLHWAWVLKCVWARWWASPLNVLQLLPVWFLPPGPQLTFSLPASFLLRTIRYVLLSNFTYFTRMHIRQAWFMQQLHFTFTCTDMQREGCSQLWWLWCCGRSSLRLLTCYQHKQVLAKLWEHVYRLLPCYQHKQVLARLWEHV